MQALVLYSFCENAIGASRHEMRHFSFIYRLLFEDKKNPLD